MFVVRPPSSAEKAANRPEENLAETIPPGGLTVDATKRARIPMGMGEEEDSERTTDGPAADDTRTWKLRLGGLTYAFPSKDSLQQWLVTRESLDGVKLMREGEAWRSLDEMPEILTPQIRLRLGRAGTNADPSTASDVGFGAPPGASGASSPFSGPPEDELAKARSAAKPGAATGGAAAAARKTLAGLQAIAPPTAPSSNNGPKKPRNADANKGGRAAKPKKTAKLAVIFVILLASVVTLHMLGVINLGVLLPELDNRKQTAVIQGGLKKRSDGQTTSPTNPDLQLPPTTIAKTDGPSFGDAVANVKQETPEERQARLVEERTQIPKLLASEKAEDWAHAEKLLVTSLLEAFPEDEALYRLLAATCTKTNNTECQKRAQTKVDEFIKREQDRIARIARWHQEAQQKLQTKKPGDAGEALLLVNSLLEHDPESIDYNKLLVESYRILNQKAEEDKAQAYLDTLLVSQGLRTVKSHLAEERYDEAIEVLEKDLLKRDAKHPEFLTLVVEAYNKRGGKKDLKAAAKYQKILDNVKAEAP